MTDGVIDINLRECLRGIFARYPILIAYLYGSEAAGNATPLSDVDIALVLAEGDYDPKHRLELELMVEDEIARKCKIGNADVRVINEAPLMVRGEVITNGILLYSRNDVFRVEYETSTRSEYFDFMPIAVMHREAYFDRLRGQSQDG